MADLTREDHARLFDRALAYARVMVYQESIGAVVADARSISNALRDRGTLPPGTTLRDLDLVSGRAIRAVRAARELRANPADPVPRGRIPFNRAIRANQSEYEYRVVVSTTTNGQIDPGGVLVRFGSGDRLTLAEVQRRALREFQQIPDRRLDYYDTRLRARPEPQALAAVVVSISRFEPLE